MGHCHNMCMCVRDIWMFQVDEGLSPQQLPHWPQQLRQRQLLPLELPATFDIGQKDDKVPDQLKKNGGEGRQFLVNENPDLDWTPTFNLKAPLRELLARDLSTAMVVITGATLLRSYDLEFEFETEVVAGCKKVLGGRATISTTETTRNEITENEMKANLLRHISMLTTSAVLVAIFLSGAHRLSGTHSLKAQSGIDFNHRMTEMTRENDNLKGTFIEVRNLGSLCHNSINVTESSSPTSRNNYHMTEHIKVPRRPCCNVLDE